MKKLNLTGCAILLIAFLGFIEISNAQTKLWGVGALVGQADAQFANNFTQSGTFAAGTNPTTWTALSVYQSDNTVTPGVAYWERSLTGLSQGGYATNMTAATSPSLSNGIALFDSDFLDNGGTAGAFGTGVSPTDHKAELISPRIDLSGATDSAILINFYSYYRPYQVDDLSLSISLDDGATWAATASILAFS